MGQRPTREFRMLARPPLSLALLVLASSCAPKQGHPKSVAVIVDGDRGAVGTIAPHAVAGLELQPLPDPGPPPSPPPDASETIVAGARKAYGHGEWASCLSEIRRIDLVKLLAAGQRALAARALTFEIACHYEGSRDQAQASATRFANLGLDVPGDFLPVDVEQLITTTIAATSTKLTPIAVAGEAGARLAVDGRPAGCAVPCTIDLATGDHVLAVEADGFAPISRLVRVPDEDRVSLAQPPASAELAAHQWRARLARGLPATDATGVALIARLAGQPNVVVVRADKRLHGTLIVDGVLRAHADRDRGEVPALMRDLAYNGKILDAPRVWQRPWFWIAISGAALAVAGTIVYVTYEPEIQTMVKL